MKAALSILPLLVALTSAQWIVSTPTILGLDKLSVAPKTVVDWSGVNQIQLVSPITTVVPKVLVSPLTVNSQYHAQDELGQFAFGHSSDKLARNEVKTFDGKVRGDYSYVDPLGKLINVQYLADENGFRVLGANNLPVAPIDTVKDTPEVAAAKEEFARKFKEAEEAVGIKKEVVEMMKEDKKEEKVRNRRDVLLSSFLSVPVVAKATVKTTEFKPVDDVKTPAATKLAEFKDSTKDVFVPWGVHTPTVVSSPIFPSILI